jgi:SAM-dependent methyltransferase
VVIEMTVQSVGLEEPAASVLRAVPNEASRILDLGSWEGQIGAWLKAENKGRTVYAAVDERRSSAPLGAQLDGVFCLDIELALPDIPAASLDCIVVGDLIELVSDPVALLRNYASLLKPGGEVVCCISNAQHVSVLCELVNGDYRNTTGRDARRHRFTWSSFVDVVLEAGLEPEFHSHTSIGDVSTVLNAAMPLIDGLGIAHDRAAFYLSAYQYIFRARPRNWEQGETETPLTFVVCVNDDAQLQNCLLRSPCLQPGTPHQVIEVREASSAAEGLNHGLDLAEHDIVILLHQDVYLPSGWTRRFLAQYRQAQAEFGDVGLVGVFGARASEGGKEELGRIVDRHRLLERPVALPGLVETVDEVLMAVPKDTKLRFDPALGWHLYGADFALQVAQSGGRVVIVDALCFHHSKGSYWLPDHYRPSALAFTTKWQACLPVYTPCMVFHTVGDGSESIAKAD